MSPRSPLPARVLIPVANPATAAELVRVGVALADPRAGSVTALGIVEVPDGTPLSDGASRARQARRMLQKVLDFAPTGARVHSIVRIGRHAAQGIVEAAVEEESDLILFGWGGRTAARPEAGRGSTLSPTIDHVVREAGCDVGVVKQRGATEFRRILVPVRGGPHAELALRFADAIAQRHGGTVVALHFVPPGITAALRAQQERALRAFVREQTRGQVESVVREAPSVRSAILREAETADLVVMGASAVPSGTKSGVGALFGALPESVATRARCSVVVVKTAEPIAGETFERLESRAESLPAADRAMEASRAVPAKVERWFGEKNYHHAEFADLERLVALKQGQGVRVSLLIPARDVEATIGPIVRRAVRELRERAPLLDEVIVVDAGSRDRTREVAAAEGARVVAGSEILGRYGTFAGLGEAFWKGLHETSGDLVVRVDPTTRAWHPRLVYGLLGPLLQEPRIAYVKGCYRRPSVEEAARVSGGAGPVTELVVRPLLSLFFPELSGLIGPLVPELAGRRSLLEALPCFTDGAFEIGQLVDAANAVGLEGIAQVDLERPGSRHGDPADLSRAAFAIAEVLLRRVEEGRRIRLLSEASTTLKLPRAGNGRLDLEAVQLADQERPPLIRVPEYVERRRPAAADAASGLPSSDHDRPTEP